MIRSTTVALQIIHKPDVMQPYPHQNQHVNSRLSTIKPTTRPTTKPSLTPTLNPTQSLTPHPTPRTTLNPTPNTTSDPSPSSSPMPTDDPTERPTPRPTPGRTNPTIHPSLIRSRRSKSSMLNLDLENENDVKMNDVTSRSSYQQQRKDNGSNSNELQLMSNAKVAQINYEYILNGLNQLFSKWISRLAPDLNAKHPYRATIILINIWHYLILN